MSNDSIVLREYEWPPRSVALDSDDALFLSKVRGIDVGRAVEGDEYFINPNQYVGVLMLPSGRRLQIVPKVPVESVFHMLAVASGLTVGWREEQVPVAQSDELFEWVAAYFVQLVQRRIDAGLYRSYEELEDNLAALRGRIHFTEHLRHNQVLRHRIYCRYAEFTWDIPENQVIRQVIRLLRRAGFRSTISRQLADIDAVLDEVTPSTLDPATIDRFRYHRLNEDYQPIHQLCRLFLESASVSEHVGALPFRAFLLDMNHLFERFVTEVLRRRIPARARLSAQELAYFDRGERIVMWPDIVVRVAGATALVADCKYKSLAPEEFKNFDHYQVLAYCTAAGSDKGALLYPRHMAPGTGESEICGSQVVIRQMTIDLSGKSEELERECDRFAHDFYTWAGCAEKEEMEDQVPASA